MFGDIIVKCSADVPVLIADTCVKHPSLRHTRLLLFRKYSTQIKLWLGLVSLLYLFIVRLLCSVPGDSIKNVPKFSD